MGIKGKPGFKVFRALIPFALNAGLMKSRKGLTPVMGKEENWGAKMAQRIDRV
jgi:hypothetical protein